MEKMNSKSLIINISRLFYERNGVIGIKTDCSISIHLSRTFYKIGDILDMLAGGG